MQQGSVLDEVDRERAQLYRLMAVLLARPPEAELLDMVGRLDPDASTPLGNVLDGLAAAARRATVDEARREYGRLFIGVARGELMPYASYYITGFLMDRPLIAIRDELARLGVERADEVKEPEDHIAAELEVMAALVERQVGAGPNDERRFFERQLAGWTPAFFRDLEQAESAEFYRPVGALGRLFISLEREAFSFSPPLDTTAA